MTAVKERILRTTRSGREFSPFLGEPVYIERDFDLVRAMQRATREQAAAPLENLVANDDREPVDANGSAAAGTVGTLAANEDIPDASFDAPDTRFALPDASFDVPDASDGTRQAHRRLKDNVPPPSSGARPRTLAEKKALAPVLFQMQKDREAGPAALSESKEDTISKEKYHQRKRKNGRRTNVRTAKADVLGSGFKGCVWKHRRNLLEQHDDGENSREADRGHGAIHSSCSLAKEDVPLASSSQIGRLIPISEEDRQRVTTADFARLNLKLVDWDGRESRPLVMKDGLVGGVLGGTARFADNDEPNKTMQTICEELREVLVFDADDVNRRGPYKSTRVGTSLGGGQPHPMNLVHHPQNEECIAALMNHPMTLRVANFGNFCLRAFAPRVHVAYGRTLNAILDRDKSLRRNFKNNVFAAMTLNLGPQTVTYRHTDNLNVPWGWCSITAFGTYNPDTSGHLILWDLGLAIRFPPGSTILIPSAILRHSNAAVSEGERRYSLTQYTAGALFRWVECGFESQKSFIANGRQFTRTPAERWEDGLQTLSTWDEIREQARANLEQSS